MQKLRNKADFYGTLYKFKAPKHQLLKKRHAQKSHAYDCELYPIHTHYIPSKRCSYSGHRSINFVNNNMHKKVILRTVSYIQGWVMTFPRFAECEARLASASLFPGVEDTCRPARVSNSWAESAPSHTPIFSSRSQH